MSRFNYEAYAKLYPRVETPEPVETPVETFTPTTNILNGDTPDVSDPVKDPVKETITPVDVVDRSETEVIENGAGEHNQPGVEQ